MAGNLRIPVEAVAKLEEMARESGKSISEVANEAIDLLYRKRFLNACNRAYEKLRKDKDAWEHELQERALLDVTLADGFK